MGRAMAAGATTVEASTADAAGPSDFYEALASSELSAKPQVFTTAEQPFVVVHVNPAWIRLCGYTAEEMIGKTCCLLQGPGTCARTLEEMHKNVSKRQPVFVRLLNYKKSGMPFLNDVFLEPLQHGGSDVTHYRGILSEWATPPPAHPPSAVIMRSREISWKSSSARGA